MHQSNSGAFSDECCGLLSLKMQMLLTHLCSGIIDLAEKMLITLKTEAPVAITPALFLFQCVGITVIMYLAVLPFSFCGSLFPCFLSNLRLLSQIHFLRKGGPNQKRGRVCMFHNKEKTESRNETWAHFFHGPPGKGYFSSVSVHPETEPDLFNFQRVH